MYSEKLILMQFSLTVYSSRMKLHKAIKLHYMRTFLPHYCSCIKVLAGKRQNAQLMILGAMNSHIFCPQSFKHEKGENKIV